MNFIYNFVNNYIFNSFSLTNTIDVFDSVTEIIGNKFSRNISLLEAMILTDGFINAIVFFQEYIVYRVSERRVTCDINKLNYKRDIIKKTCNLYVIRTIERYLMYVFIYCNHLILNILCYNLETGINILINEKVHFAFLMNKIFYLTFCCATIPQIQNIILTLTHFEPYLHMIVKKQNTFIKYSISKIIINFIEGLDNGIIQIKNYHIFKLYKHISTDYFLNLIKTYGLIQLLYILRQGGETYYYYKAIKLSYYYNTGYMFNALTIDQAVFIINIIIKEKRWYDLTNIEVVNALYTLYKNKFNFKNDKLVFQLYILQFLSIWSIICILKTFTIVINTIILLISLMIVKNGELRNILGVIYLLVLLNSNDLIISLIFIGYKYLYYFGKEIYFFIKNQKDIEKVIDYYKKK